MKILGIDFGLRKIGLSIGVSGFAEPLKVIRYKDTEDLIEKVLQVLQVEQVERVVVGVSDGQMAEMTKDFVKAMQPFIHQTIILHDENFSTKEAIRLSIEAGINRKKRKGMEDAYAATIMLQNYLDSNILN